MKIYVVTISTISEDIITEVFYTKKEAYNFVSSMDSEITQYDVVCEEI